MTVTRDTLISDILQNAPDTAKLSALFSEIGMHCLGCALSSEETVEEACLAHGNDVDAFLKEVNDAMTFSLSADTLIADVLRFAPECEPVFYSFGMHCLGCSISSEESLGEAAEAHGVDAEELIAKCKEVIEDFAVA
jgi:hybrid cluster-associated redox disulfide protein